MNSTISEIFVERKMVENNKYDRKEIDLVENMEWFELEAQALHTAHSNLHPHSDWTHTYRV